MCDHSNIQVLDLATAVIAGVVLSALCFAWNQSCIGSSSVLIKRSVNDMKERLNNCRRLSLDDGTNDDDDEKENILVVKDEDAENGGVTVKVYSIRGPIFFSSVKSVKEVFQIEKDPKFVEVHLHNAQICD